MAFDMYAGQRHDAIDHHEEYLFTLIGDDEQRFPVMSFIWHQFYDGPRLSVAQSTALIYELLDLLECNGGISNKPLVATVSRLILFFRSAQRDNLEIRCASD